MNNVLAIDQAQGVIESLKGSPWYTHLLIAALLGAVAYGLRELDNRQHINSGLLDITMYILALSALALTYQGLFGN